MNIFTKLFKLVQSVAHAIVGKLQDPILMAEQAIRDLKSDYDASMHNLAEVKALAIETEDSIRQYTEVAKDYERKALALVQRGQSGDLTQENSDRLASEALKKKQDAIETIKKYTLDLKNYESMINTMETKVDTLKQQINHWEDEIKTLKARHKVALTSQKISKQMVSMSDSSAQALLENMAEKVSKEEALSIAYNEMASIENDIDAEINAAIGTSYSEEVQQQLLELKRQVTPQYLLEDTQVK